MAKNFESIKDVVPIEWHMVPKSELHQESGTDAYHGGAVLPLHAGLQPAKFVNGLYDRAAAAGAQIATETLVIGIDTTSAGAAVVTNRGKVAARDVIVATNDYTSRLTPGLQRRVIPIGSYMIATEEIPDDLMRRLIPKDRVMNDTRKVIYYYRPSPDHKRVVFGGRVALKETDPLISGPRLHGVMAGIWPELKETKISHSWMGFVAYTFDHLPHIGQRDGVWYSMGYCGSGVASASYLGHKPGAQDAGRRPRPDRIRQPQLPDPAALYGRSLVLIPNCDEQDSSQFVVRSIATQAFLAVARARRRACQPAMSFTQCRLVLGIAVACYQAMDRWGP